MVARVVEAAGEAMKARLRNTKKPKLRATRTSANKSSIVDLQKQLAIRTRERDEALEQQTATSEVLKVISNSPEYLEPVFEAILKNATRICQAKFATLFNYDGEKFFPSAHIGAPPTLVKAHNQRGAFKAVSGTVLDKIACTKSAVQTEDDSKVPHPGQHV